MQHSPLNPTNVPHLYLPQDQTSPASSEASAPILPTSPTNAAYTEKAQQLDSTLTNAAQSASASFAPELRAPTVSANVESAQDLLTFLSALGDTPAVETIKNWLEKSPELIEVMRKLVSSVSGNKNLEQSLVTALNKLSDEKFLDSLAQIGSDNEERLNAAIKKQLEKIPDLPVDTITLLCKLMKLLLVLNATESLLSVKMSKIGYENSVAEAESYKAEGLKGMGGSIGSFIISFAMTFSGLVLQNKAFAKERSLIEKERTHLLDEPALNEAVKGHEGHIDVLQKGQQSVKLKQLVEQRTLQAKRDEEFAALDAELKIKEDGIPTDQVIRDHYNAQIAYNNTKIMELKVDKTNLDKGILAAKEIFKEQKRKFKATANEGIETQNKLLEKRYQEDCQWHIDYYKEEVDKRVNFSRGKKELLDAAENDASDLDGTKLALARELYYGKSTRLKAQFKVELDSDIKRLKKQLVDDKAACKTLQENLFNDESQKAKTAFETKEQNIKKEIQKNLRTQKLLKKANRQIHIQRYDHSNRCQELRDNLNKQRADHTAETTTQIDAQKAEHATLTADDDALIKHHVDEIKTKQDAHRAKTNEITIGRQIARRKELISQLLTNATQLINLISGVTQQFTAEEKKTQALSRQNTNVFEKTAEAERQSSQSELTMKEQIMELLKQFNNSKAEAFSAITQKRM